MYPLSILTAISGTISSTTFTLLKKLKCKGPAADEPPKYFSLIVIIIFFLLTLVINVIICMALQGLSFVDSFYMLVITLTTIGYGDIVPAYTSSVFTLVCFVYIIATPFVLLIGIISEVIGILDRKSVMPDNI